jgi:hypothetical protein
MDEFAMDASATYQDMEPMIEAKVYDPLPDGLVEPEWLAFPEIEQSWLDLPELEQGWHELPSIEQNWLQAIDQGEPVVSIDTPELEQGFDLEP